MDKQSGASDKTATSKSTCGTKSTSEKTKSTSDKTKSATPIPSVASVFRGQTFLPSRLSNLLSSASSALPLLPPLFSSLRLDARVRALFRGVTPEEVDLSLAASLATFRGSPALLQLQLQLILLTKAIARLIAHSVFEDDCGVLATSKRIPKLINAMIRLHLRLHAYAELAAHTALPSAHHHKRDAHATPHTLFSTFSRALFPSSSSSSSSSAARLATPRDDLNLLNGHSLAQSFTSSTLATLSECIYQITTTYYEHLQTYTFPTEHIQLLQRFVDFTA